MSYPKAQTVSLLKIAVSMILSIVAIFFSFSTFFVIDLSNSELQQAYNETYEILIQETSELEITAEIPDEVDLSVSELYSVGKAITKVATVIVYSALEDMAETTEERLDYSEKYNNAIESLNEFISSEEGQIATVTAIALISQSFDISIFEAESSFSTIIGPLVLMELKSIAVLFMNLTIIITFIALIISFIINLIRILTHLKNLSSVSAKACRSLNIPLELGVTAMLFLLLLDGVTVGSGLTILMILSLVNILFGAICTRLRKYTSRDFKYLNIVQATTVVQSAGAFVFFTYAQKTGIFKTFINAFFSYIEQLVNNVESINFVLNYANQSDFIAPLYYLIDLALVILAALCVLSFCSHAVATFPARLSLTKKRRSNSIGVGVIGVLAGVLPLLVANFEHATLYTIDLSDSSFAVTELISESFLTLSSDVKSALIFMIAGAAVVLIAGIVSKVLKKILCPDMGAAEENLILSGNAYDPSSAK